MTNLYVWKVETAYFSERKNIYMWALAVTLPEAKRFASEKVKSSVYTPRFREDLLKVIGEEPPYQYHDGDVGMF